MTGGGWRRRVTTLATPIVDANMHSANLCNAHLKNANLRDATLDHARPHGDFVGQETRGFEDYLTEKGEQGKIRISGKTA